MQATVCYRAAPSRVSRLWYFEDCAVLGMAHVCHVCCRGQHCATCDGKNNSINVVRYDYLPAASLSSRTHIPTSHSMKDPQTGFMAFGFLKISAHQIANFRLFLDKVQDTNSLLGVNA